RKRHSPSLFLKWSSPFMASAAVVGGVLVGRLMLRRRLLLLRLRLRLRLRMQLMMPRPPHQNWVRGERVPPFLGGTGMGSPVPRPPLKGRRACPSPVCASLRPPASLCTSSLLLCTSSTPNRPSMGPHQKSVPRTAIAAAGADTLIFLLRISLILPVANRKAATPVLSPSSPVLSSGLNT